MANRFWKGLRSLEILTIFSIILTLAFIVYTRYDSFKRRAMQSEAKFYLGEIYAAQMRYRSDFDIFASFDELANKSKRVVLSQNYYDYADKIMPNKTNFLIIATGKKGTLVAGEVWSIDEENNLSSPAPGRK